MGRKLLRCTCVWGFEGNDPRRSVADPFCPAEGRHGDER